MYLVHILSYLLLQKRYTAEFVKFDLETQSPVRNSLGRCIPIRPGEKNDNKETTTKKLTKNRLAWSYLEVLYIFRKGNEEFDNFSSGVAKSRCIYFNDFFFWWNCKLKLNF